MLRRLELIGFKSFADKTRFDFAPGITAIVGPNGSGKSNVVDAVKWILGEQSAKSLRGGEMADVIFNGSASRKSLGLAEVTMTFDNTRRHLQFDGDEVQITRRVYRDGQGEYLINHQAARLKDIKEMFLGSGAGHGAYSIIEQGRVDALLTASTKDRRQIFEEAAGISRFKAKKHEALRKLEATELNLNRVKDILRELEKTLRTLQGQAAKAQKYQDYQARLKQLRVRLSLHEFRELSDTIAHEEALLGTLRGELGEATAKIDTGEATLAKLDWDATRNDEAIRVQEKKLGVARQRIAEHEAQAKSQRQQAEDAQAELLRIGAQAAESARRLKQLEREMTDATQAADAAQASVVRDEQSAEAAAAALAVVLATIAELTRQSQAARDEQFALVGRAAQFRSTAEMTAAQLERLDKELLRKKAEGDRAQAEALAMERVLADLSENNADLQSKLVQARAARESLKQEQAKLRAEFSRLQPRLDALRDRRGDLRGRVEVLEQLEKSREGLGTGVKYVLDHKAKSDAILGLVAELVTVPHDIAALVDLALGDAAQRFVVTTDADVSAIIATLGPLSGRVGFIPLEKSGSESDASSTAAALAHAVTSHLPGLAERLLGDVYVTETLSDARAMKLRLPAGSRFVTRSGELLEADGTIIAGPLQSGTGILSRKSELRDSKAQLLEIERDVQAIEHEQASLKQNADALDAPISGRETEVNALANQAGDLRDRLAAQTEKRARLVDMADLVTRETTILAAERDKAEQALKSTTAEAIAAETAAATAKETLTHTEDQLRQAESTREARQDANMRAQVALSKSRQSAQAFTARCRELAQEQATRTADLNTITQAEAAATARQLAGELAALRATAAAADAYRDKDERSAALAELNAVREQLRSQRDAIQNELKSIRDAWKTHQDQAHAHELTARDLVNRRISIESRMREDYGIELVEEMRNAESGVEIGEEGNTIDEDEMQAEIDELKRKIARLGSVNLEALEQLGAEEAREKTLRTEFADLDAAEKSLLEIIETINADSRRLFTETLDAVKGHFQELFRKLFGGGIADIVLENPADVLESGIEITARPPGKELRSISLLSGGEKTMTAVALLLAIFRSKPSPFCLLDEVDAALDEANTARLASVLRDFLDRSQFIIITHKKRTMAMADVLYGITMQESGISKQVATRIDDWPDDDVQPAAA